MSHRRILWNEVLDFCTKHIAYPYHSLRKGFMSSKFMCRVLSSGALLRSVFHTVTEQASGRPFDRDINIKFYKSLQIFGNWEGGLFLYRGPTRGCRWECGWQRAGMLVESIGAAPLTGLIVTVWWDSSQPASQRQRVESSGLIGWSHLNIITALWRRRPAIGGGVIARGKRSVRVKQS